MVVAWQLVKGQLKDFRVPFHSWMGLSVIPSKITLNENHIEAHFTLCEEESRYGTQLPPAVNVNDRM